MQKSGVTGVDPNVAGLEAGFEEDQITRAELITTDVLADSGLVLRGTREFMAEPCLEGTVDEAGAVYATLTQPTHLMRSVFPSLILLLQDSADRLVVSQIHRVITGSDGSRFLKGTSVTGASALFSLTPPVKEASLYAPQLPPAH